MKYEVIWAETNHYSAIVEADNPEDAEANAWGGEYESMVCLYSEVDDASIRVSRARDEVVV